MRKSIAKHCFVSFVFLSLGALSGCHPAPDDSASVARRAERRKAVSETVAAGPQTKSWSTPHGDVIELFVPSSTRGMVVTVKRCIIWRDHITSSSSMSCDTDGDKVFDPVDDSGNDIPYRF